MQKDIKILLEIQELDMTIRAFAREIEQAPRDLNTAKENVEQMKVRFAEGKENSKKLKVIRKELEIDLDSQGEEVKKYEMQLTKVKTNEEYKVLQKQITDLKFKSSLKEDKILEQMEQIEKATGDVKKLEQEVSQAQEQLKQKEKEVAARVEQLKGQRAEKEKEKEQLLSQVSVELLDTYARIFNNKTDRALVAINNKTCGGCHMKLPPNVINETKKGHRVILCENCARILYWSE